MSTQLVETINKSLDAPTLDPVLLRVANDHLAGDDVVTIATRYGVSPDRITGALDRPDVKRYIDKTFETQGYMSRHKRMQLINKVIDNKLEEAAETGLYTKKDLLDWVKLVNEMDKTTKPGTNVQINQQNNIVNLVSDLLKDDKE